MPVLRIKEMLGYDHDTISGKGAPSESEEMQLAGLGENQSVLSPSSTKRKDLAASFVQLFILQTRKFEQDEFGHYRSS